MKKILAAVDGSPASLDAARSALELARAFSGELTLVHVGPPLAMLADNPLNRVNELRAGTLSEGERILKAAEEALHAGPLSALNLMGSPAETIAEVARDQGFDLVVVGNKGRGAVTRMLLGSVADRLTHICHCPVLVVR